MFKKNLNELAQGQKGTLPYAAPETLLVWGHNRVVPIKITSLAIIEQAFDADLKPIRAKVQIEAQTLNSANIGPTAPGFQTFMTYQKLNEAVRRLGTTTSGAATKPEL